MSAAPRREMHPLERHARTLHRHLKHHFIPHKENDYKPYALRHRVLVGYSVFLILLKVAAVVIPIALPYSSLFSSSITIGNIIELTNENRKSVGLAELKENSLLDRIAQAKANDMLTKQYFAHTSPSGATAQSLMRAFGYPLKYGGENLAVHFTTAEDTTRGWMASPSHRANIVNSKYTEIGIGIANGDFEGAPTTFIVQMFGTPKSSVTEPTKALAASAPTSSKAIEEVDEPAPAAKPAVVDDKTLSVKPTKTGYTVKVAAPSAKQVQVQIGTQTKPLQASTSTPGTWVGEVAVASSTMNMAGEPLNIIATTKDGATSTALGLVSPSNDVRDMFLFQPKRSSDLKLFGTFDIYTLSDDARKTFLYFMVFLSGTLLVNMFVASRIRHASIITHTVGVIGLAAFLFLV